MPVDLGFLVLFIGFTGFHIPSFFFLISYLLSTLFFIYAMFVCYRFCKSLFSRQVSKMRDTADVWASDSDSCRWIFIFCQYILTTNTRLGDEVYFLYRCWLVINFVSGFCCHPLKRIAFVIAHVMK